VRHGSEAPKEYRDGKSLARAEPVHESADEYQSGGIRQLEGEHDIAVIDLAPVQVGLKRWFQQADDLAIDVVHRCGKEQQSANEPAIIPDLTGWTCGLRVNRWCADAVFHDRHKTSNNRPG